MIYRDYLKLAHGFSLSYSEADAEQDIRAAFKDDAQMMVHFAWHQRERDLVRILEAKDMSRDSFFRTLTAPKPSWLENLVFCAELRRRYDLNVQGFINGIYQLPKPDGVIVPIKTGRKITGLRFVRMSEMLKPRKVLANPLHPE